MEVESSTDIMASLMKKLKPGNPWVPSRSWDSRPLILTPHFLYPHFYCLRVQFDEIGDECSTGCTICFNNY